jgi:FKBP-type peptidyl-prolyl cis-trans isomerase SlyD
MSTQASITVGKVVSIHYTLRDEAGAVLDSSGGGSPLDYLHGAGNIVPGLEEKLEGHAVGDRFQVRVPPEDGYGVHDPRGVQKVPRASFPSEIELEPGMQFGAEDEGGVRSTIWIQAVDADEVTIDLNHPLAGKQLDFDITVAGIRDATEEELAHGHPHGPHGHHHHA